MNIYDVLKEKEITLPAPPQKEAYIHRFKNSAQTCCTAPAAVLISETETLLSESSEKT